MRNVWLIVLQCMLTTLFAAVRPVEGSLDLNALIDACDVVVGGRIATVRVLRSEPISSTDGRVLSFRSEAQVNADRFYKGSGAASTIVFLFDTFASSTIPQNRFVIGQPVLLFLKKADEPNRFILADPFFGVFGPVPYISPTSDKLSGNSQLQKDLIAGLNDKNRQRVLVNLELLLGFKHLDSTEGISSLTKSENSQVAVLAYSVLLRNNTFDEIPSMLAFLRQTPESSGISFVQLANSLGTLEKYPKRTDVLSTLSQVPQVAIRNAAVNELRRLRDPDTIPVLLKALDDPDPYISFTALKTLAEISGVADADYSPDVPSFLGDRARYVAAWKARLGHLTLTH